MSVYCNMSVGELIEAGQHLSVGGTGSFATRVFTAEDGQPVIALDGDLGPLVEALADRLETVVAGLRKVPSGRLADAWGACVLCGSGDDFNFGMSIKHTATCPWRMANEGADDDLR